MDQVFTQLRSLREFSLESALHWVDILLVTYLIYRLLLLLKGTRAWRIMFGVASFVLLLLISKALKLNTLSWILDKGILLGPVALVILLLPELRQALESFGKFWPQQLGSSSTRIEIRTLEEVVAACTELAATRVGAIIVLEREANLDAIVTSGVILDAKASAPLLGSIFHEGNPLHDGAAVLRGDTIVAAACRLPLSESSRLDQTVHMRHRAAVGVTEALDCVAIVVSEERGTISVAMDGRLRRLANPTELREILNREIRGTERKPNRPRTLPKPLVRKRKAKPEVAKRR